MTANGWLQILVFLLVIFAVAKPLGVFMTRVFSGGKTFLDPLLRPLERLLYKLTGVDEKREMRWTEYAIAMLLFSGVAVGISLLWTGAGGNLTLLAAFLVGLGMGAEADIIATSDGISLRNQ